MSFSRRIECYHSHADPIWPDSTYKDSGFSSINMYHVSMSRQTEGAV